MKSASWTNFRNIEKDKEYFKELQKKLDSNDPKDLIYRAFETPLNKIRVVIIGQYPYNKPNQANGLAFAVNKDQKIPPTLKNIIKESGTSDQTLCSWAEQGVFLLNTSLTVREIGWGQFTDNAIKYLLEYSNVDKPLIFCLWGHHAEEKRSLIKGYDGVTIISSSHPSPLTASKTSRPFTGSNQFERINDILKVAGSSEIRW